MWTWSFSENRRETQQSTRTENKVKDEGPVGSLQKTPQVLLQGLLSPLSSLLYYKISSHPGFFAWLMPPHLSMAWLTTLSLYAYVSIHLLSLTVPGYKRGPLSFFPLLNGPMSLIYLWWQRQHSSNVLLCAMQSTCYRHSCQMIHPAAGLSSMWWSPRHGNLDLLDLSWASGLILITVVLINLGISWWFPRGTSLRSLCFKDCCGMTTKFRKKRTEKEKENHEVLWQLHKGHPFCQNQEEGCELWRKQTSFS